ncbi:Protein mono-ADP-ribosyltransferase PARP12, partial [Frankliniella fusca]
YRSGPWSGAAPHPPRRQDQHSPTGLDRRPPDGYPGGLLRFPCCDTRVLSGDGGGMSGRGTSWRGMSFVAVAAGEFLAYGLRADGARAHGFSRVVSNLTQVQTEPVVLVDLTQDEPGRSRRKARVVNPAARSAAQPAAECAGASASADPRPDVFVFTATKAAAAGSAAPPPSKTAAAAGTSAASPSKTAAAAGTSAAPPSKTAAAAGTSAAPPSKTAAAAGTSAASPSKTAAAAGTSAAPPSKTAAAAGTSAAPPSKTAAAAGTSAARRCKTAARAGTARAPRCKTAAGAGTSAAPPSKTAAAAGNASAPASAVSRKRRAEEPAGYDHNNNPEAAEDEVEEEPLHVSKRPRTEVRDVPLDEAVHRLLGSGAQLLYRTKKTRQPAELLECTAWTLRPPPPLEPWTDVLQYQPLEESSTEYQAVRESFARSSRNQGFVVTGISRVENAALLKAFQERVVDLELECGDVAIVRLYHGTRRDNIDSICRRNLDLNWAGAGSNHTWWGHGVNFSPISYYSSHYCDHAPTRSMLVFDVVVGRVFSKQHIGKEVPALPEDPYRCYDTNMKLEPAPQVVVKFVDNSFYPAYVIDYEAPPPPVGHRSKRRGQVPKRCAHSRRHREWKTCAQGVRRAVAPVSASRHTAQVAAASTCSADGRGKRAVSCSCARSGGQQLRQPACRGTRAHAYLESRASRAEPVRIFGYWEEEENS